MKISANYFCLSELIQNFCGGGTGGLSYGGGTRPEGTVLASRGDGSRWTFFPSPGFPEGMVVHREPSPLGLWSLGESSENIV